MASPVICPTSHQLENLVKQIFKITCDKGSCSDDKKLEEILNGEHEVSAEYFYDIPDVMNKFYASKQYSNHMNCITNSFLFIIKILNKKYMFTDDKKMRNTCSKISLLISKLPDTLYPIKYEFGSEDSSDLDQTIHMNIELAKVCLKVFLAILFFDDLGLQLSFFLENKHELTHLQRFIFKQSASKVITFIASRLGKHPWTDEPLRIMCDDIIKVFCKLSNHKSVMSLMSGTKDSSDLVLFPEGLVGTLLAELKTEFVKDKWKSTATLKHALIWCITKVKFPNLGKHVPTVVPALLLMMDDYSTANKLLGISTMQCLVENVNPTDLKIFNHANVIYDALYKQLFSSDDRLYEVALPCLLRILCVLDDKASVVKGVLFTSWDTCLQKILDNLDFASTHSTRRILLQNLPSYISHMGANVIKHLHHVMKVICYCLELNDGENETMRLLALDVLKHTILVVWPVVSRYEIIIFKSTVKLLVDIHSPSSLCNESTKKKVEMQIEQILLSMETLCGPSYVQMIDNVLSSSGNAYKYFSPVLKTLKKVKDIIIESKL